MWYLNMLDKSYATSTNTSIVFSKIISWDERLSLKHPPELGLKLSPEMGIDWATYLASSLKARGLWYILVNSWPISDGG